MSLKEVALYIASLTLFALAICAYVYESRYTDLLPVITYPFRAYAIPLAFGGLVLLVLALFLRRFSSEAKNKTSASDTRQETFILAFLFVGFVTKIVGEAIHELLGHGLFVLLFGGEVTHFYISLTWPYDFSYVGFSLPSATASQMIWIIGGGILVSAIISFSIQAFLLWKRIRWQLCVPLFWLSFWCYANATGYLVMGGVFPFGDVEELIGLGVLTSSLALLIGVALFLIGFFILSKILRGMLATFLRERTRWGVLAFWFVIPALVGLTMAGRGIFPLSLIPLGFIPILLSYLLEFQVRRRQNGMAG